MPNSSLRHYGRSGTPPKTPTTPAARDAAKQSMVALLNRRSYIRNLVRDVNSALE